MTTASFSNRKCLNVGSKMSFLEKIMSWGSRWLTSCCSMDALQIYHKDDDVCLGASLAQGTRESGHFHHFIAMSKVGWRIMFCLSLVKQIRNETQDSQSVDHSTDCSEAIASCIYLFHSFILSFIHSFIHTYINTYICVCVCFFPLRVSYGSG